MPHIPRFAVPLLALAAVAATAPAAQAVEQEGTGSNITPIKNIQYPNLHAEDEVSSGTDIEFATLTVGAADVAAAPETPVATPVTAAPPAQSQTKKRKKKARAPLSCRKAKNRYRSRKSRRRYAAQCRRALARRRAKTRKRSFKDAAPRQAGLQREFAFAGSYGDGLQIIDITDPANSTLVSTWDCGISQGDVQLFQRQDLGGRWFAAFTHDDGYDFHADAQCAKDLKAMGFDPEGVGGAGTYIADVTDPYSPKTVSFVPFAKGSHNQTVHPSGRYLYNSNSDLITSIGTQSIEIVDISSLSTPQPVGEFALQAIPGLGTESHDITFSSDGSRAYVAALSHNEILDTTDPAKPAHVGTIVDPTINVFHQSDPVKIGDRNFLFIEDEVAGAIGTGQCPNGGVHVYDITGENEASPQKVGYWNIDDVGPTDDGVGYVFDDGGTCTAHVFRLHEDAQLMTIAYYNGGVRVVDISGVEGVALGENGAGMKQLGSYRFPDSNAWSVKAPRVSRDGFYMYANDHRRGLDVFKYEPEGEKTAAGRWYSPAQLVAAQEKARAQGVKPRLAAVCLLGKDGVMQAATQAGLAIR